MFYHSIWNANEFCSERFKKEQLGEYVFYILELADRQINGQVKLVIGQLVQALKAVLKSGLCRVTPRQIVHVDQSAALVNQAQPGNQLFGTKTKCEKHFYHLLKIHTYFKAAQMKALK